MRDVKVGQIRKWKDNPEIAGGYSNTYFVVIGHVELSKDWLGSTTYMRVKHLHNEAISKHAQDFISKHSVLV